MYKNKKRKQINFKILIVVVAIVVVIGLAISVHMSRSSFLGEGIIKDVVMTIDKTYGGDNFFRDALCRKTL